MMILDMSRGYFLRNPIQTPKSNGTIPSRRPGRWFQQFHGVQTRKARLAFVDGMERVGTTSLDDVCIHINVVNIYTYVLSIYIYIQYIYTYTVYIHM